MKQNMLLRISTAILVMAFMTNGVFAMSVSDVGKVCLFSNMTGVITLDGKPVANARLVRTVNLSSDETDETTTDENGNFQLPAIFKRTVSKYLPQEFAANQQIIVHYNDKEYRIWSGVKRKPDENTESRGKPLDVKCELNSEETMIKVNNSPIFSLCTWDVEPDKRRKAF